VAEFPLIITASASTFPKLQYGYQSVAGNRLKFAPVMNIFLWSVEIVLSIIDGIAVTEV
jgi:hypothetical protein